MFIRNLDYDYKSDPDPTNPDHLIVKPKKGRVLIWFDMHPNTEKVDHRTLHGGQPVVKGQKSGSFSVAVIVIVRFAMVLLMLTLCHVFLHIYLFFKFSVVENQLVRCSESSCEL